MRLWTNRIELLYLIFLQLSFCVAWLCQSGNTLLRDDIARLLDTKHWLYHFLHCAGGCFQTDTFQHKLDRMKDWPLSKLLLLWKFTDQVTILSSEVRLSIIVISWPKFAGIFARNGKLVTLFIHALNRCWSPPSSALIPICCKFLIILTNNKDYSCRLQKQQMNISFTLKWKRRQFSIQQ